MHLKIEKIVPGGWGLAKMNGKVIFVPYVLPNEIVKAKIFLEKKDYAFAEIIEIVSPSPQRISPICPHFGVCGGCDYQHIPYDLQVKIKENLFKDEIVRQLGKEIIDVVKRIIPATNPFFYRNRIHLKIKRERHKVHLGFFKKNTHELIPLEKCFLAIPAINEILIMLKTILKTYAAIANQIKTIEIFFSPNEEKGIIILHTLIEINKKYLKNMAEKLIDSLPALKDVLIKHSAFTYPRSLFDKGYTESGLFFKINNFKVICYPGVFFQVNTDQNKKLLNIVAELANLSGNEKILELYAGMGNLSLLLASRANKLIGLDNNKLAVRNANYNAQLNKVRAFFKKIDVDKGIKDFLKDETLFDCLVLDPPRQGCLNALKQTLNIIKPKKIIYVSCHPATLARDLKFLSHIGYKIKYIQPIDMFPQTHHIEAVAMAVSS